MIAHANYNKSEVDAIITATCDWQGSRNWYRWMKSKRNCCLFYGTIDNPDQIYKGKDSREKRLCWFNTMFSEQCFFLPTD
jgi:hypothetical protein